uniref:Uncharacterized protein n=1 Tax=Romanomermis culicivorax TaxID=13658 RepID=A0A915K887_ROMCU
MPTSPLSEATPPGSTPHRNRPPGLDAVAAAAHFRQQQQQQQQTQQHHPHFPMRRPSSPTAHLSPNLSIPHLVNHQTPDQQTYNRHFNHRASIS